MTRAGVLTTIAQFDGTTRGLVQGSDSNFYGTTSSGGAYNLGTVFKITPDGVLSTLVEFNDVTQKGRAPLSVLVQGGDGSLYGTTQLGGAYGSGTVFKVTPAGVLTTLVEFTGNGANNKGANPECGLVWSDDGNLYGTTSFGGASNLGTLFRMTPVGVLTTLHEFSDSTSGRPVAPLIRASDGNLYGTASGPFDSGTIYRLVLPGAPNLYPQPPDPADATREIVTTKVNPRGSATAVSLEYGTDGVSFPNKLPVAINLNGYQTTLIGTTIGGLTAGVTYYYRFSATSIAGITPGPVQSFSTLAEPIAIATGAGAIQNTSARFNGTVNARNYATTVLFEYGADGNTFPYSVPAVPGTVTGNTDTPVSAPVAGLTKGTTYYYRVVATNAAGTTVSGQSTFTTLTDPLATVGPATAVTSQSAKLNGMVNARGAVTSVSFEYGTDGVNFTNSVGATPPSVDGNADIAVSATLSGLAQGATYYYQVKGTSAGGVGISTVATFALDILSGFTQVFPGAPTNASGFVLVTIDPLISGAGWRFVGEKQWRTPGLPLAGLTFGQREIEFRPAPGYNQPPRETVILTTNAAFASLERTYYLTPAPGRCWRRTSAGSGQ